MCSDQDYRSGLSAEDLVRTLRGLLAAERTAVRLTCRYLADFADCLENGSGDTLACYGELTYSRAREVTRVAKSSDESAWLELARTLPMRALERRVVEAAGNKPPSRTSDPAEVRWTSPEAVAVSLRLPAETWALLQRAMEGARRVSDASLSDAEALAAVARDALAQQNAGAGVTDPRHTVVLYECQSCGRTELDTGAGALELEDGAAAVSRSEDGEHSRSNCVCLCTKHHRLLHDGRLRIEGDAESELRFYDEAGTPMSSPTALPSASHRGTSVVTTIGTGHQAAALLAPMGQRGGWSVDRLVESSGLRVSEVVGTLLVLELDGRVCCDASGSYTAAPTRRERPVTAAPGVRTVENP